MVECAGLENRYGRSSIEGSNPSLSAVYAETPAYTGSFGRLRAVTLPLSGGSTQANLGPSLGVVFPPSFPPSARWPRRNSPLPDGGLA